MTSTRHLVTLFLILLTASGWVWIRSDRDRFDHREHAELFPTCTTCHAGATTSGAALFPDPLSCAACHDGVTEDSVRWTGAVAVASNLAFDHIEHQREAAQPPDGRSAPARCADCHTPRDSVRMVIHRTSSGQCLECHTLRESHYSVPDSTCATCHLPLARATTLPDSTIASFPTPANHEQPGFIEATGHGALATAGGKFEVAPSCATCHARDFCISCHVDAPEQRAIQALAPDRRSLAIATTLREPTSHRDDRFALQHGKEALANSGSCATCHTRESCLACHLPPATRTVERLAAAGPGRGAGASVDRRRPATHGTDFATQHGTPATAAPAQCTTCHTRTECLDCHLPGAGAGSGFHPSAFLTRHPTEAYRRESSCADCHNTGQFCASCHRQAGLTTRATLGTARYHDAKQFFIAGHGPAARRSLETCVGCHVERDCLTCHSALGGRRFNPHGPGFDPERLRKRNPEMCSACHGASIPR